MQINSYLCMNRSKFTYRSRMTQRTNTTLLITKTTRDAMTTYRAVDVFPLSGTEIAILHHETFNFLSNRKYFSQQSLYSGHQDITKKYLCYYARLSFLKKKCTFQALGSLPSTFTTVLACTSYMMANTRRMAK